MVVAASCEVIVHIEVGIEFGEFVAAAASPPSAPPPGEAASSSAEAEEQSAEATDEGGWLDLDVVDTSWMEGASIERHNCFYTNLWLIDDLREMLVTGKRASERSARLVRRRGNVWSFLAVAPGERSKTWREDTPLTSTRAAQF